MQNSVCFFGLCAEGTIWVGVLLWLLYALAFLFTRAFLVAGMLRRYTRAEIEATRRRIRLEQERPEVATPSEQVVLDPVEALLKEVQELLREAERAVSWNFGDRVKAVLAWNGGAELGTWRLIHTAERLAVEAMSVSHLRARLLRAKGDLAELPPERREVWKEALDQAMKLIGSKEPADQKNQKDQAGSKERTPEKQEAKDRADLQEQTPKKQEVGDARAILSGFLADLYEARDERFARVLKMQNLLSFMVIVGLLVGMVMVAAGYGPILLAGATGGLLSRLSRIYRGSPQTPDYGLSWAQVFPSSLFGALSAWAGLHLLALLQSQGVLSMQEALGDLSVSLVPPISLTIDAVPLLALGALFGLSERLLDRMVEKTEELWQKREAEGAGEEQSPGLSEDQINSIAEAVARKLEERISSLRKDSEQKPQGSGPTGSIGEGIPTR
ncbi:hypothetical protein HRbin22_00330 [Candidatus Thermoflexus japonica]|uniref:Uncharacterized protein n=1 Tax=Candidatus Thermoflexus japonica TaxID=2035417 RepID=A0A2H5Y434_9CHLR|nr:hypothetical protein HRbin22_00330 [Candidatus Thermoflexus japonica]